MLLGGYNVDIVEIVVKMLLGYKIDARIIMVVAIVTSVAAMLVSRVLMSISSLLGYPVLMYSY